jgi:hypothetical protein
MAHETEDGIEADSKEHLFITIDHHQIALIIQPGKTELLLFLLLIHIMRLPTNREV